jgi:hypothetical protein
MLLTENIIDDLHLFRVSMMKRLILAMKELRPSADGIDVGAGYATFPGDGSNLTQVYGISHRGANFDLAELDAFYEGKADNWELIVTPFEAPTLMAQAVKHGYVPDHFETVLALTAKPQDLTLPNGVEIHEMSGDLTTWVQVSDAAWSERDELLEEISWFGRFAAVSKSRRFLAFVDGEPAAVASLVDIDGKCMFAGAATLPKFRGRGLQTALTRRRLAEAGPGAFVQVVAMPGSQSHRNLQRIGFSPLYSKLVMFRRG